MWRRRRQGLSITGTHRLVLENKFFHAPPHHHRDILVGWKTFFFMPLQRSLQGAFLGWIFRAVCFYFFPLDQGWVRYPQKGWLNCFCTRYVLICPHFHILSYPRILEPRAPALAGSPFRNAELFSMFWSVGALWCSFHMRRSSLSEETPCWTFTVQYTAIFSQEQF